jgi:hypothetical protein
MVNTAIASNNHSLLGVSKRDPQFCWSIFALEVASLRPGLIAPTLLSQIATSVIA